MLFSEARKKIKQTTMIIKSARYVVSNIDVGKCPEADIPEYAFIGRSNVGKSSLINMITSCKGLAKTSQTPGKTLLINHFDINNGEFGIVDLPGYGYASRGKKQREDIKRIISEYIINRYQLCCLFVLVDIRHDPQKIDLDFIRWIGDNCVPFALVFTKADKLGVNAAARMVDNYKKVLLTEWEELPPLFVTSSVKKQGRDELLDFIADANVAYRQNHPCRHE